MNLQPVNSAFDKDAFLRTCQECNFVQHDKKPDGEPTSAFRNRKCKRCGSEALDYGSYNYYDADTDPTRKNTE